MFSDMHGNYGASAWSATKFVAATHASVNFKSDAPRRLSQRLSFVQKRISIGWVAVHLSTARSDVPSVYSVNADLYVSDPSGHPSGESLSHASLPSSSIPVSGWYQFSLFLAEIDTPQYGLCLVLWQDGGDEDNYASWEYAVVDGDHGCSMMVDGSSWTDIGGAHRTVRAASAFDAYADILGPFPQHRILSPPAILSEGVQSGDGLSGGTFHNTYIHESPSPYQYPGPGISSVRLKPKDLHISYVVDSSGSMGWNDRFSLRREIVSGIQSSFLEKFPGNVTYDFVQFGARPLAPLKLSMGGRPRGVMVSVDDYDSISGYDASGNPLSGDVRAHMGTGVAAYGFKGLTSAGYQVYGFDTGWSEFRPRAEDARWRPMWPFGSPVLSSVDNGPGGDTCMNVSPVSGNDAVRYVYGFSNTYNAAYVSSDIHVGDDTIQIGTHSFTAGNRIRISSSSSIEQNRVVSSASETEIVLTSSVLQSASTADGAVVEQYMIQGMSGWGNTDAFEFFVVDPYSGGDIVFFVQTTNGAHIEWTFQPMSEWEFYMMYFLDETADLEVDCHDASGDPLPDGTTVEFYVDKQPTEALEDASETSQKTVPLVSDASTGAAYVYISPQDVDKFSRGATVDIVDDDRNAYKVAEGTPVTYHVTTVSSVSENGMIGIADVLPSAFTVSKHASLVTPSTEIGGEVDVKISYRLPIIANLVDITPIYVGSPHDPSLLGPLDPPQVDPSAGVDDYNTDETRVARTAAELITKNGWAAVRVCPITEDKFEKSATRDALAKSMFNPDERDQVKQKAIEDMEKGEMKPGADDSDYDQQQAAAPDQEEIPVYYDGIPDFTMDHKVKSIGGYAVTHMKSFATELSKETIGIASPVEYLARKYAINPVVTMYGNDGKKVAVILVDEADVYFVCPVYIRNTVDKTVVYRQCQETDEDGNVVIYDQTVPGTFATDPYDVNITYDVTSRGFPVSGFMRISVYDLRRTKATRTAADDDLPDIDGCGDDDASSGDINEFSTSADDDEYSLSTTDMLLADDLLPLSQMIVPVTAGAATVTLPPLNRVALLEVHASFDLDDGVSRVVNRQKIYYRNPIVVTLNGMGPKAADGETTYDIGASVSWKDVEPVSDGTMVNFESERTWMSPSVSQTISGTASGVIIGPHAPIPAPTGLAALEDDGRGEFEGVTAICSYRGFTTKKDGQIEWMRPQAAGNFYFYATGRNTNPGSVYNGTDNMWSDGLDYVTVNGDLPASSFRAFPFIDTVADDLIQSSMGAIYSGSGLTAGTRLPRWSESPPVEGPYETDVDIPEGWVSNRMYSNMFIGRPECREPDPDDPWPCDGPQCATVSIYTKSRKYNSSGIGIQSDTPSFLTETIGGGQAKIPKPRVYRVEPFGVTVYIEPMDRLEYQESEWRRTPNGESPKSCGFDNYNHPLKRDGKSRYLAVAEVTWRDEFIVPSKENPLPTVTFDVGALVSNDMGVREFKRFEDRTICPLDYDSVPAYHSRTSFDTDHFHGVSVDDDGKGATTSTVSYTKGVIIPDHVHAVDVYSSAPVGEASYILDGNINSHTHRLKSVAIVGIGPVSDKTVSLAVKAESDYDGGKLLPDGSRIARVLENYAFSYPYNAEKGDSGYVLEIIPTSKQYVDGKVVSGFPARIDGSSDGYTVLFHAYIKTPGGDIPVMDGTRIFSDFGFYEYNDVESEKEPQDGDLMVIGKDEAPRTIAVMKISAFIPGMPEELKAVDKSLVTSNLHWLPSVQAPSMVTKPETDSLIFSRSLDSMSEIGPSRLNDAVALAARRMVTFAGSLSTSKKVIVVVSDGSESNSELSYDQAVSSVRSVDVKDPVDLVFVKLERTEPYDDLVVRKFISGLSGVEVRINDVLDAGTVPAQVYDAIVSSPSFDLITGWYSNIVDLGTGKLFDRLKFTSTVPGGSDLSFSVRFSDDGVNFGEWTELGSGTEFDLSSYVRIARYMEYRVTFRGDPDTFESPSFSTVGYEYYEPRSYTLLFQPVPTGEGDDGYVGEIIFAHQGDIPSTSSVSYGIKHAYGVGADGYWSEQQPGMKDGYGSIVLSRVNELLLRRDAYSFAAAYGGWTSEYGVSVFRMSVENKYGSAVSSTSYTYDAESGVVVFGQAQPETDTFTLTLSMKPVFRIAADIVNHGPSGATVDYFGAMYRPVDKSYMYTSDRRPVYSALETDFATFGVEPGNLPVSSVIYNNFIGEQSDVLVDIAGRESVNYVLAQSSGGITVIPLRENFTSISRNILSGVTGTPSSIAFMDGSMYVCVLSGGRWIVHRIDDAYASVYSVDIGAEYEHSGVIRPRVDLWHVSDGASVSVMDRSFRRRIASVGLSTTCSGKFYIDDGYVFVSKYGDALLGFSSEGQLKTAYIIGGERAEGGGAALIGTSKAVVRKSSVLIF